MKRVTQKDIAKAVGVHLSTVSLVLKNSPRIPDATKKIVLEMAEKMGYQPDPQLAALAYYRSQQKDEIKRNQTLAFLTNEPVRWEWKKFHTVKSAPQGATKRAHQLGYGMDIFWLREPGMTDQRISDILHSRGIRGILINTFHQEGEFLDFTWEKFCVVKMNYNPRDDSFHSSQPNHLQIIKLAVQALCDRGYRKLGLWLKKDWSVSVNQVWEMGFEWMVNNLGLAKDIPVLIGEDDWKAEFQEWYQRHQPEVVISCRAYVIPWLEELGMKVGEDVSYIDLNVFPDRNWAGVKQDHQMIGECAVDILHSAVVRNDFGPPIIIF